VSSSAHLAAQYDRLPPDPRSSSTSASSSDASVAIARMGTFEIAADYYEISQV
jgi:hypothetical protein